MKKDLLTVKELAAELRMSAKSIQRAYRKEEIPALRVKMGETVSCIECTEPGEQGFSGCVHTVLRGV